MPIDRGVDCLNKRGTWRVASESFMFLPDMFKHNRECFGRVIASLAPGTDTAVASKYIDISDGRSWEDKRLMPG